MTSTDLNFDTFAKDAHTYINDLAHHLEHPNEEVRVLQIWRAVMHTIRDRIPLEVSFKLVSQLPMILKGIYVENWKYQETPPLTYSTLEEMKTQVKTFQEQYGEDEFPWKKPTEEIILNTVQSLKRFLSEAHIDSLTTPLPKEVETFLSDKL